MDTSEEWLLGDVEDTGGNPILFQDRMISDSVEYEHSYSNAIQDIKEEKGEILSSKQSSATLYLNVEVASQD